MDKKQYLQVLETRLRAVKVEDIEDILDEYTQHFDHKLADGFSEEETAARLGDPAAIAEQFLVADRPVPVRKPGSKVLLASGLGFLHILVGSGFLSLFCCVIVLGAFALAVFALGTCLVSGTNIAGLIPPMPWFGALLFGLSFFSLGILSTIGTLQLYLYTVQWIRAYGRWTRNVMGDGRYPPLSTTPHVGRRFSRFLRTTTVVSLVVFLLLCVSAAIALTIHVGFQPFWHALGWFGYTG